MPEMLSAYRELEAERANLGIPALPLNAEQTQALTQLFENPIEGEKRELLYLLSERIPPGVDEAAYVKASWLSSIAERKIKNGYIFSLDIWGRISVFTRMIFSPVPKLLPGRICCTEPIGTVSVIYHTIYAAGFYNRHNNHSLQFI